MQQEVASIGETVFNRTKSVKYTNGRSYELPTFYQQFIHLSRYSRWIPEQGRRESWDETVARYFDFFDRHLFENCQYQVPQAERDRLERAVLNLDVMPSMRCMMTAGEALRRENLSGYNCSYVVVDSMQAFGEALYILMCGTGLGFSVERQYVNELPAVPEQLREGNETVIVADSREGWARALDELISYLYDAQIPDIDVSKVRPAGAPIKTFGGRAVGPKPLLDCFKFVINIFKNAVGRRLTSVECHDIMCKIGEVVVVGGVRRSALISLSNLSDERMRNAKSGQWWEHNVQRALANNSVAYTEKPDMGIFIAEWKSLYDSKSGERGIFNRVAAQKQAAKWGLRSPDFDYGTNPCSEIILRPNQLCNLSEVVVREHDTRESLLEKIEIATIFGTWQSTLTKFKYVTRSWKKNTEQERLLGVSLTGIMDNTLTSTNNEDLIDTLGLLRERARETNERVAKTLKIPRSAAITCVKPSGSVSQLVDSASGIHTRHSPYYVRTVRNDNMDPICHMMKDSGFPNEPDVTKAQHLTVFAFPIKSPDRAVFREDRTAIEQLELWLTYQRHYCEHKPSVTITVKEHEWMDVGAWVYRHFDEMSGVSFLPYADHVYQQAPYQEVSKEEYESLLAQMPQGVDWSLLSKYEHTDNTQSAQTLSCTSGQCDI